MSTATKNGPSLLVGAVKWVVLVVLALVLAGVACNELAEEAVDDAAPAQQPLPEPLDEQVYADIELGADKEDLLRSLEPVEPVEGAVLDEYELRSPETPETSCVYYERLGQATGELYRLCFEDDVLIDKTVVFPETVDAP